MHGNPLHSPGSVSLYPFQRCPCAHPPASPLLLHTDATKNTEAPQNPTPPQRVWGHFHCDDDLDESTCKQPCHWSKKDGKKSASYSCAMSGTAIATGKYGAIMFDKDGNKYDWDQDEHGHLKQVKSKDDDVYEGEADAEEEDDDKN